MSHTILDHYPETLATLHAQLEETLEETLAALGQSPPAVPISLHLTEYIRRAWGGRTLFNIWWGGADTPSDATPDNRTLPLPAVTAQTDTVRTARGRELRAVVWQHLAEHRTPHPCIIAGALAARVEREWYKSRAVYVPKGAYVDRAIRDAQVWRQFGGRPTLDAVIQEHGLSQNRIYTIYRRVQKNKEEREQPSLF